LGFDCTIGEGLLITILELLLLLILLLLTVEEGKGIPTEGDKAGGIVEEEEAVLFG
jgi:hypothetical protein